MSPVEMLNFPDISAAIRYLLARKGWSMADVRFSERGRILVMHGPDGREYTLAT